MCIYICVNACVYLCMCKHIFIYIYIYMYVLCICIYVYAIDRVSCSHLECFLASFARVRRSVVIVYFHLLDGRTLDCAPMQVAS